MSIDAIKTQLANTQEGVTGVKRAFAQAPNTLSPADLPAFVNFTGAAEYSGASFGAQRIERNYLMRLFVAPVSRGIGGEGERLVEPFFERVRAAFPASTLDGKVVKAQLAGDTGVSVLPFGGVEYLGIEFRLQTIELLGG